MTKDGGGISSLLFEKVGGIDLIIYFSGSSFSLPAKVSRESYLIYASFAKVIVVTVAFPLRSINGRSTIGLDHSGPQLYHVWLRVIFGILVCGFK